MKKSNVVLIIVLVFLVAAAWGMYLMRGMSTIQDRNVQMQQAEKYNEKALYQKAIACYDAILGQKESKTVRELWVEAYENAYNDGAIERKQYAKSLDQMCTLYPEDTIYWEKLLSLYIDNQDFNNAYKCFTKCEREGVESEKIAEYGKTILYTYSLRGRSYVEFICSTEGYYTVFTGEEWGVLDAAGDSVYENIYEYISPYSSTNIALFVSGEKQRIMNEEEVIEEKLNINFLKTGTYVDGLMAVCAEDGTWKYLDCETNSYLQGTYEQASNFADGVAAVCKNGSWTLVNTNEEQICQTVFSDIKLHKNGDYQYDGVMVAAVNGEYGFYNEKGETLAEFKAKDMDVYLGGNVAFADASGKWGFVDKSGEVAMEPQFAQAKSFANKLAAVGNGEVWGFVNKTGEVVIDQQFVDTGYFTAEGTCMVSLQEGQYNLLILKFVD